MRIRGIKDILVYAGYIAMFALAIVMLGIAGRNDAEDIATEAAGHEDEYETIRWRQTEYTEDTGFYNTAINKADPPVMEAQEAWIASDTPQEDAEADQFELLCQIVMAEGGNTEPDLGIRLMADGVLNRVESPLFPDSIEEVVYQREQFEPVSSGTLYKWVPTERVIQICAQEMANRTNLQVLYWKTKGYHAGTTPIAVVGHHYYSGR